MNFKDQMLEVPKYLSQQFTSSMFSSWHSSKIYKPSNLRVIVLSTSRSNLGLRKPHHTRWHTFQSDIVLRTNSLLLIPNSHRLMFCTTSRAATFNFTRAIAASQLLGTNTKVRNKSGLPSVSPFFQLLTVVSRYRS